MATQTVDSSGTPSAQVVGIAFVEQYYQVLHNVPADVHKFYNDSSMLSRPGQDGEMTSATTMQGINDIILSLDLKDYNPEILTIDAQVSYKEGIIVLVTGCLTGKKTSRRKFTQTFFLARQERGRYYVLNDVFRFVDEDQSLKDTSLPVMDVKENSPTPPVTPDSEPADAPDHTNQNHTPTPTEEVSDNGCTVSDPSETKVSVAEIENKRSVVEEVVAQSPISSRQTNVQSVAESSSNVQEEAPKMSYASILAKEGMVASTVQAPPTAVRVSPSSNEQRSPASPAVRATARSNSMPHSNSDSGEVYGIYVGNLPSDVTAEKLEDVFKTYGRIKKDGIQIRRYLEDGFCYGFVDFESSSSARSAIEIRRIIVGDKEAYIEEKKTVNRGGNGGGRFPSGKVGFHNDNFRGRENFGNDNFRGRENFGNDNFRGRENFGNDNFRGRGNFGGGRAYARYENGNNGEYSSSQARGRSGQNGENYQRGFQNGGGRFARQGERK